ncbi:MAG: esterase [Melioribacteraceae bacterium]|nr:MAG: esterase [Melioribacteraceae bacterium]
MHKEVHKWYSSALEKEMEIAVYGHYGYALLMFPTAGADFLEYERFGLIDDISYFINHGIIKVFSIGNINHESWLNNSVYPPHKSLRHGQYNNYIISEVVPFIHNHCNGLVPIVNTGASLGAYHAVNMFFRHPDIFKGVIGMSGIYDIKYYSKGYYDQHCYFNSPVDYMPRLSDERLLREMQDEKQIIIASGEGDYEDPGASVYFSNILRSKHIPHQLEIWGRDMKHDWPTWKKMLPFFLSHRMNI